MDAASSQSKKRTDQPEGVATSGPRESLWGTVLFAGMLMFVLASVSGIGWVVYSQWKIERVADNQPSIGALPALPAADEEQVSPPETASTPAEGSGAATPDNAGAAAAKKLTISVLNGGGAKGSAGILADTLKKEGYTGVSPGNTIKDYSGVTVYYAANLEKEAESVKGSVIKKYPQVTLSAADAKNKETSASQITVIIGK